MGKSTLAIVGFTDWPEGDWSSVFESFKDVRRFEHEDDLLGEMDQGYSPDLFLVANPLRLHRCDDFVLILTGRTKSPILVVSYQEDVTLAVKSLKFGATDFVMVQDFTVSHFERMTNQILLSSPGSSYLGFVNRFRKARSGT